MGAIRHPLVCTHILTWHAHECMERQRGAHIMFFGNVRASAVVADRDLIDIAVGVRAETSVETRIKTEK